MAGAYPEVEKSLSQGQIQYQIHPAYKTRPPKKPIIHSKIELVNFEYDFSLEEGIKTVFTKEREPEAEEDLLESSEEEEVAQDSPEILKRVPPPIPPRPKLDGPKKVELEPGDSGVSSGGENGMAEIPQPAFPNINSNILLPTSTSVFKTSTVPKPEASVLDIFDVSRDDPFERAQMSAIDDMAELRDVLEKSQTPSEEKTRPKPKPRLKKITPVEDAFVSEIQSLLDSRQSKTQQEKKENFSKSALDALNSLPVIDLEPVKKSAPRRPKTPEVSAPVPKDHQALAKQLIEVGYDKFIVAKSISIFGNDEEKCFDYLSAYTELVSAGHAPSLVISTLQICEFSLDESKIFLQKSPRYLEMGFDNRDVRNALIRYPNEPHLQLESLMMGRT